MADGRGQRADGRGQMAEGRGQRVEGSPDSSPIGVRAEEGMCHANLLLAALPCTIVKLSTELQPGLWLYSSRKLSSTLWGRSFPCVYCVFLLPRANHPNRKPINTIIA